MCIDIPFFYIFTSTMLINSMLFQSLSAWIIFLYYAAKYLIIQHTSLYLSGKIPIMLRSAYCLLSDLADRDLNEVNECPLDPGGYFVINGSEKVSLSAMFIIPCPNVNKQF